MDAKQEKEFESFGCASRCLIALANANGTGLTKATFIDRYAPKYWQHRDQCGGLTFDQIKVVAKDLGLARDIPDTTDFSIVRGHIKCHSICSLLVYTQKRYEQDGGLSVYHHCTVVGHNVLQRDDFLYLTELDYISGHGRGLYLPESAISPLIPVNLRSKITHHFALQNHPPLGGFFHNELRLDFKDV